MMRSSGNGRSNGEETCSRKPAKAVLKATVEDAEDESDGVERGRSTTTVQTPEPETDDEWSAFIL